jgi:tRNA pseudouridine38-40 synthase
MAYNYKMIIGYDGAKYQGWQKNKNAKDTIQSKLESTLSEFLSEEIQIIGSGRTDKGVHAQGQVVNFVTNSRQKPTGLQYHLNKVLPEDIIVKEITKEEIDFNCRFAAKSKTYRYTIWKANADTLPLFERKYVYRLEEQVDVDLMLAAATKFIGEHDFKGFSSDKTKKGTIRTVNFIDIIEDEDRIEIVVNANGFLYNMVRIMVGTLIEIGLEQRHDESIDGVFASTIRSEAGYTAPAHGLCLMEVLY